jgi:diaminohydroxyphosphoribosylaminopyrimidine deaminase/5-amino-6-(5-phosphoribosylamino)uracil reductase
MFTSDDHRWMLRAIELAARGMDTTTPNPRVGCVVVRDGQMVGEGWHVRAGEPHAEVIALAHAGARARGATVYLTLEPCSHHGRTPPCTDALVEARVARVIAAMEDPNPLVNGEGLSRLRAAGIEVRCGLLGAQAADLNPGFVSRMTRAVPWVRMKLAASLDGFTALQDGRSQWITGESARADGHRWRARACAILTGIGTVREDNPQMNVRLDGVRRQPLKVLVDSRLEVDLDARVLKGGDVLVVCAHDRPEIAAALRDRGCEVMVLPNAEGKVDLPALMRTLAARGCNEVHVEAGHKLNASLVREGCVDELLVYLSASLLGRGRPMFELDAVASLDERIALQLQSIERFDNDVRLLARVARAG